MSSCSGTSPQMGVMPPAHAAGDAPAPMSCDGGADAVNGQHHLLRHVLSAEQCSDALHHFGTTDSKAAARMVNRMSQRELRDTFAKVYSVHTNSNNNTWLRRKLLEAVGASRRFYAAANRTGRSKPRRPAAEGKEPHGAAAKPRSPKPAPVVVQRRVPAPHHTVHPAQEVHHSGAAAAQHHFTGPSLPAGSPRALSQRRQRDAQHPLRHHYLLGGGMFRGSQPSSEAGDTSSEGSDSHPCALAPHRINSGSGSGTPTSACAAALAPRQPQYQQHPQYLAQGYLVQQYMQEYQQLQYQAQAYITQQYQPPMPNGSNSSLQSSQFPAAPLHPRLPSLGLPGAPPLPGLPVALPVEGKLPSVGSFTALAALTAAEPPAPAAAQSAPMAQPPSLDLGGLWLPSEPSLAQLAPVGKAEEHEDWLTFDDFRLPALF